MIPFMATLPLHEFDPAPTALSAKQADIRFNSDLTHKLFTRKRINEGDHLDEKRRWRKLPTAPISTLDSFLFLFSQNPNRSKESY